MVKELPELGEASKLCKKNDVTVDYKFVEPYFDRDFRARMDKYEFNFAFDILWEEIGNLNKHIDAEKPWTLAKTDPEKAKKVLADTVVRLLTINDYLKLFLPDTAEKIADIFTGVIEPPATPLFPKN